MKYKKIQDGDALLSLDTDFVKNTQTIENFTFDNIKDFGIHVIPVKSELNENKDANFKNVEINTIYFVQGKNKLNDFAFQLHKAISGEIKVGTDETGVKVYRLEYSFTRKGKVSERLHGYATADKLVALCEALYSNRVAKKA